MRRPKKLPGERYDTDSYRRAIDYATAKAFPPPADLARGRGETKRQWQARLGKRWAELVAFRRSVAWSPHQLRHGFATRVTELFSAEHAMKSLGHSNLKTTMIYAKLSLAKAKEVARAIG